MNSQDAKQTVNQIDFQALNQTLLEIDQNKREYSTLIDIYAKNNRILLQWSNNDDYQQIAQTTMQLTNYMQ